MKAFVTRVPAGCDLTVRFWVRTTTTETIRGDYLNVGLAVTGTPPKTRFSLAFDGGSQWRQYSMSTGTATIERTRRSASSPARRPATAPRPSTSIR